jgi:two-component system, chemotaxis family, chemotaxis protein CheY
MAEDSKNKDTDETEKKPHKRQEMYIINKDDDDDIRPKRKFTSADSPAEPSEPLHTESVEKREIKQKARAKKGKIRSLVVDDEFVSLTKMTTILSSYGQSDAATHGEQAYKLFTEAIAENKAYDLITIDIGLPGINGLELLQKIHEYEQVMMVNPARKVMVTVDSEYKTVVKAARSRCNAFLVKPIKKKVFIDKLEEIGAIGKKKTKNKK